MGKILAIGGGNKRTSLNTIDKELLVLAKKNRPKVLFIPTAGGDSNRYIVERLRGLERKLNLTLQDVDVLYLRKTKLKLNEIKNKIAAADIIYVGDGNTLKMMNLWRQKGVDRLLLQAYKKGKVLSGSSAGAICWFKYGNSDSRKFKNPKAKLIRVKGLGIINALCCPHYDTEKDRKPQLKTMMRKSPTVAIALDECCALELLNDKYRIVASKMSANAYKIYWKNNIYHQLLLEKSKAFKPLKELLTK